MTLAELLATAPYNTMTDDEAAAAINAATVNVVGEIDSRALLRWAAAGGRLQALKNAAADAGQSDAIRSMAGAAVVLIERDGTSLDMSDAAMVGMVDALVAAGVLSASAPDDKAELLALATAMKSPAEANGIPTPVTVGRVEEVRRNGS